MKRIWSLLALKRMSLTVLSVVAMLAVVNVTAAGAANPLPVKILRAATNANGTFFVGGSGFSVAHTSTGNYHVSFPAGTWKSGAAACYFVPQAQAVFTPVIAEITGSVDGQRWEWLGRHPRHVRQGRTADADLHLSQLLVQSARHERSPGALPGLFCVHTLGVQCDGKHLVAYQRH